MNRVFLEGNLARDPEVRVVEVHGNQTKVANFTVAVSRFFKRRDGTSDKDTVFIPCEAWDTGAETIEKILHKGDPVLLEGSLKTESWEQDGQKRSRMKVRIANFKKLYRAPKPETSDVPTELETAGVTAGKDGDIPF